MPSGLEAWLAQLCTVIVVWYCQQRLIHLKSYAFGWAVIFYLVFCFFVISSLEFWLVCKENMFSSCPFTSVSCFPFSAFMTVLWVLKFWCIVSCDSAGLLPCSISGFFGVRRLTSWHIPSLSSAVMGHGNEKLVALQLHIQVTSAQEQEVVQSFMSKAWDLMDLSTFSNFLSSPHSSSVI